MNVKRKGEEKLKTRSINTSFDEFPYKGKERKGAIAAWEVESRDFFFFLKSKRNNMPMAVIR